MGNHQIMDQSVADVKVLGTGKRTAVTRTECHVTELRHRPPVNHLVKMASVKCSVTASGQLAPHAQLLQAGTAGKCLPANHSQRIGECKGGDARTVLERIPSDTLQRMAELHCFQTGAVLEGIVVDTGDAVRQNHGGDARTVLESVHSDTHHLIEFIVVIKLTRNLQCACKFQIT